MPKPAGHRGKRPPRGADPRRPRRHAKDAAGARTQACVYPRWIACGCGASSADFLSSVWAALLSLFDSFFSRQESGPFISSVDRSCKVSRTVCVFVPSINHFLFRSFINIHLHSFQNLEPRTFTHYAKLTFVHTFVFRDLLSEPSGF